MRSRLSPFESGGDATSVLTEAYRLLVPRVAMRSGVTVMRTRGSVCQRAREPSTWSATLATRVTGALSSRWKGGQPTLIEGQEPLPMALGRRLVIAPTPRKSEAVRHARVESSIAPATGLGKPCSASTMGSGASASCSAQAIERSPCTWLKERCGLCSASLTSHVPYNEAAAMPAGVAGGRG